MQVLRRTGLEAYSKAKNLGRKGTIQLLKDKGLKGRGGAEFPTGKKWGIVLEAEGDKKYVICNADEGEPGTFKDKHILQKNPETVIEGLMIAAFAAGAEQAFIYLRGEYDYMEYRLRKTADRVLSRAGSSLSIRIIVGAGSYVCGDETAIISSIEGYRGQPRQKPPFPTTRGLFGKPTIINNVETLANAALAIAFEDWNPELRLYSLSGDVSKPGVYELPHGIKLCELLEMGKPKNRIKAVYFGCFGGCMPNCDIELTPDNVCGKGCLLGACSVIAVDETRSMVDMATNIAKFYEFESCGKCTSCREGTMRILAILENLSLGKAAKKDLATLEELAEVVKETSFCGLGQTSMNHLITALKYFRKEFEERLARPAQKNMDRKGE